MTIDIKRDKSFKTKVRAEDIHGNFPYKLYLEIKGNSKIGKYIVVVSNKQLNKEETVDNIIIYLTDNKIGFLEKNNTQQLNRPNMIGNNMVKYKVRERSIMDVDDTYLIVFKPVKE